MLSLTLNNRQQALDVVQCRFNVGPASLTPAQH